MFERTTFRQVADLLSDAIVMTDENGLITWTNRAFYELCGHPPSTVKHRKPGSFLQGPETNPDTVRKIRKAIAKQESVNAEIINYHRNGRPYWVSISITPVKNKEGTLKGFIAIEREITSARLREFHLQEEVGQLYASLVHAVNDYQDTAHQ
jgi:PAS domain S-box-containing protein